MIWEVSIFCFILGFLFNLILEKSHNTILKNNNSYVSIEKYENLIVLQKNTSNSVKQLREANKRLRKSNKTLQKNNTNLMNNCKELEKKINSLESLELHSSLDDKLFDEEVDLSERLYDESLLNLK